MPNELTLTLDSPLQGVIRRTAYQTQPPFSCYDSLNFWPLDCKTGRAVFASRPGLQPVPSPGGLTVNMLARVNGVATTKPLQGIIGAFSSDVYWWNGTSWTAATGAQASAVVTNRPVYATAFLQEVFIFNDTTAPLVFSYVDGDVVTLVATAGTVPLDCRFGVVWQGALWIAGQLATPNILYASRVGDAYDWDFSVDAEDEGGAFFTGGEDEGLLNGPITALMPQTADSMIISTMEGLSILRRHPRQGGEFESLSAETYVLGQGAWCKTPGDVLFFMTPLGLMKLDPGETAVPTQISRNLIPEDLLGLIYDYENPVVSMCYDSRWNGIHITVRDIQEQAWWYDLTLGGFHKMSFTGYPYVLNEYPPFVGETTSGVLYGGAGYGSLARMDTFSDESFTMEAIIGPIKISQNANEKSIITQVRSVFGRDTPVESDDAAGRLQIAVGSDGQDAVNRILLEQAQYTQSLDALEASNGVCYPRVSGHAMAVRFQQTGGSLALEEQAVALRNSGFNRMPRSPQIPVTGSAITFDPPSDDFDDTIWVGYTEATPDAPTETLTDMTLFIDLSGMDDAWWGWVSITGQDIRATDVNNNPIPLDLIEFDYANQTGFAAVKITQTIPARPVRLWVGNPLVGLPAANSEFGQYNAYDAFWRQFLPNGQTTDRTQFLNHCTNTGLPSPPTDALVTGPMGNFGTNYRFTDTTNNFGVATASVQAAGYPVTLILAGKNQGVFSIGEAYGIRDDAADTTLVALSPQRSLFDPDARTTINSQVTAGSSSGVTSTIVDNPPTWHHFAGTVTSAASRRAYLDGVGGTVETTSRDVLGLDEIVIGKPSRSGLSSTTVAYDLSVAQYHTTARSEAWIAYQSQMMVQPTFWNGWGDFQEENDPPTPPDPDVEACPSGIVPVVETGTWSGYAAATPIATYSTSESNWSHWVDLSRLPNDWWTAVLSSGQDIRATDSVNIFIPFDLVNFNKSAKTGFAVVKLSQTTTPSQIRLWVGNATAVAVSACAAYGKYAAYDQYWGGFWPNGGGNDRTQYLNHLTMRPTVGVEGPAVTGDATGIIGVTATNYNGYDQYGVADTNALVDSPLTFIAVAKHPANNGDPDFDPDAAFDGPPILPRRVMIAASNSILEWRPNDNRAATTRTAQTGGAFSEVSAPGGSFRHYAGLLQTVKARQTYINGDDFEINVLGTGADQNYGADSVVVGSALARFPQTWERVAGAEEFEVQPFQPFYGDLCLVSMHSVFRGQNWVKYQNAMLTQATFWGVDWAWTAQSSSLPQS